MTQWLKYTDKEVECFHPVCDEILSRALEICHLSKSYKVEHHRFVKSLEMDFVISNRKTNKILCVIEVKRTIGAVLSTRYQHQAMSYVQELRNNEKEKSYYILTNLETVALFKYSTQRPNVEDQLLNPGVSTIARFSTHNKSDFIGALALYFAELIKRIMNDDADYFVKLSHFVSEVSTPDDKPIEETKWNSKFVMLAYEYIRGALSRVNRNELQDIRRFRNQITHICREALRVNFKGIFGLPPENYGLIPSVPSKALSEAYELGHSYLDADSLSDILFKIIANDNVYPGEVPTDIELARAVMVIAHSFVDNLQPTEKICDPAAGSGNLLSVAPLFYSNIKPSQIKANDINPYLLQVLSLRLGLKFPQIISPYDCPSVSNFSIEKLPSNYFNDVKIVIMNPPYLSHMADRCSDWKELIYRRIKEVDSSDIITKDYKSPLEAPFLELVTKMTKPGTVIACVMPRSHIVGQGISYRLIRELLINQFGLVSIFCYPQSNIFSEVAQSTCVVVGVVGSCSENISYIGATDTIDNLDYDALTEAMYNANFSARNGITREDHSRTKLIDSIDEGWRDLDEIVHEAKALINKSVFGFGKFVCLESLPYFQKLKRGKSANNGGSDLLFPKDPFKQSINNIISNSLKPGLRRVMSIDTPYLERGDSDFLDVSGLSDEDVKQIATTFKNNFEASRGRQMRNTKTVQNYIDILHRESNYHVSEGTILFPRDVRANGRAYLTKCLMYPSSNVYTLESLDTKEATFIHSWICSIFYQLHCEIVGKNMGGTRKMDGAEIGNSVFPVYDLFSEDEIDSIISVPVDSFISLRDPQFRECDFAWAKLLCPDNPRTLLTNFQRYLIFLSSDRES